MSEEQENGWCESNIPHGAFGNILERMNNQFAPNHESQHYQSGFVPAANPAWNAHPHDQIPPMTYSHQNSEMIIDPTVSMASMNSVRSYSVSQETYPPDLSCNRTPLNRSSSDLGIRMGNFTHPNNYSQLDGYMSHQIESLDGPVFYSEATRMQQISGGMSPFPVEGIRNDNSSDYLANQQLAFSREMGTIDRSNNMLQETASCNNFATKFSNFTASLGTWFSPLDPAHNNFGGPSTSDQLERTSMTPGRIGPVHSSSISRTPLKTGGACSKPSYSDVLSKAPSQERVHVSSSISNQKNNNSFQSNCYSKNRSENLGRSGGKSKGRNNTYNAGGRSNSPNMNSISGAKHSSKSESSSFSKVGLDDFDLPENVTAMSSRYSIMNNLNNISKNCNIDQFDHSKKRSSLTSEESSPTHQMKKGNNHKNDKRVCDKYEDSPQSSDIEKSHGDKLNNHSSLASQQKQTPKYTHHIKIMKLF